MGQPDELIGQQKLKFFLIFLILKEGELGYQLVQLIDTIRCVDLTSQLAKKNLVDPSIDTSSWPVCLHETIWLAHFYPFEKFFNPNHPNEQERRWPIGLTLDLLQEVQVFFRKFRN